MKTAKILCASITFGTLLASALVFAAPAYSAAIPPSATLKYQVTASYNGMSLSGTSVMNWKTNLRTYSLQDSCSVNFFGNVLNASSSGTVDNRGLAPSNYAETKMHKRFSAAISQSKRQYMPSDGDEYVTFNSRAQDHSSVVWHLSAIANANKGAFASGSYYTIPVIGHRHVKNWTFRAVKQETISTPAGRFNTVVISGSNGKNQTMQIWYAKDNYYYPVQLYLNSGSFSTRQTLSSIR